MLGKGKGLVQERREEEGREKEGEEEEKKRMREKKKQGGSDTGRKNRKKKDLSSCVRYTNVIAELIHYNNQHFKDLEIVDLPAISHSLKTSSLWKRTLSQARIQDFVIVPHFFLHSLTLQAHPRSLSSHAYALGILFPFSFSLLSIPLGLTWKMEDVFIVYIQLCSKWCVYKLPLIYYLLTK